MSIRMIAKDLYRLKREVELLEKEIKDAPPEKRESIEDRLRKTIAERNQVQRVLEGAKEPPSVKRPK